MQPPAGRPRRPQLPQPLRQRSAQRECHRGAAQRRRAAPRPLCRQRARPAETAHSARRHRRRRPATTRSAAAATACAPAPTLPNAKLSTAGSSRARDARGAAAPTCRERLGAKVRSVRIADPIELYERLLTCPTVQLGPPNDSVDLRARLIDPSEAGCSWQRDAATSKARVRKHSGRLVRATARTCMIRGVVVHKKKAPRPRLRHATRLVHVGAAAALEAPFS